MPIRDNDSPFLIDDKGKKYVGLKHPDGTETELPGNGSLPKIGVYHRSPIGTAELDAPGMLGLTTAMRLWSPVPWYGVRLTFMNPNTTAVVGMKAIMTTSTNALTPNIPANPNWKTVTFNSGATTGTLPAATAPGYTYTKSDIMPVASVPRTDGQGFILDIYCSAPSAGNTNATRYSGAADYAGMLEEGLFQTGTHFADAIASPGTFERTIVTLGQPIQVELFTLESRRSMMVIGDSTVQGQTGTGTECWQRGGGAIASALAGYSYISAGRVGLQTNEYTPSALTILATHKPTVAFYAPWSVNNANNFNANALPETQLRALAFIEKAREVGTTPILMTCTPKNGITSGEETFRRGVVAGIKQIASQAGVAVHDRDSVFTNYAVATGGFKAGLSTDTVHPSPAGYILEAAEMVKVLP